MLRPCSQPESSNDWSASATWWPSLNATSAYSNGLQLGHYRVLRFPSWVVRYQPDYVAAQIRQALREAGYAC